MIKLFNTTILTIFFLPFLSFQLGIYNEKLIDNRELTKNPKIINYNSFKDFIYDYEKFFNDNILLRSYLITLNNYIKFNIFNTSPNEDILIGIDKSLFYFTKNSGDTINDYLGINQFSMEDLSLIKKNIEERIYHLKKKNINFYVIVVPNKESIDFQKIPSRIIKKNSITKLIQLESFLDPKYFYSLRLPLLNYKDRYKELYYKYDSHWNDLGSYLGYFEIINYLKKDYKDLRTLSLKNENFVKYNQKSNGDLITMLGLPSIYSDTYYKYDNFFTKDFNKINSLESYNNLFLTNKKEFKNIYFYCDSFFIYGSMQFLPFSFNKSIFVWRSLPNDSKRINFDEINIIVFEIAERYLDLLKSPIKNTTQPWIF